LWSGQYISTAFINRFLKTHSPVDASSMSVPWLTWLHKGPDCEVFFSIGNSDYSLGWLYVLPDGAIQTDTPELAKYPFHFKVLGQNAFVLTADGYADIKFQYVSSLNDWIDWWLLHDVRRTGSGEQCGLTRDGQLRIGRVTYSVKPLLDTPFDGFLLNDCSYLARAHGSVLDLEPAPPEKQYAPVDSSANSTAIPEGTNP
jgi:hypothetical protein